MDALVVDGRSEGMIVNWLLMMLDQKNNDDPWRKVKHTIFGSVCSDSFNAFRENKWRESEFIGTALWPPLILVRGRKLVLRANAIRFS